MPFSQEQPDLDKSFDKLLSVTAGESSHKAETKPLAATEKQSDLAKPLELSAEGDSSKISVEKSLEGSCGRAKESWAELAHESQLERQAAFEPLVQSVHSVHVKLADQQADVNSPLYSVSSFEDLGLSQELLKGIYAMKFIRPSKVQERALPLLLANPPQNMIAQSQSGTGKTAAFVLTMLSRVDEQKQAPQALCVAPSRELAKQICDVATQMAQFTKISIEDAVRETVPRRTPYTEQVVIGTPGTVLDLSKRGLLELSGVRVLVFDEADLMLDKQGMGIQSMQIKKRCPLDTQILLFSATFNPIVQEFATKVAPTANEIALKREELSVDAIKQFYMRCKSPEHKLQVLSSIYGLLTVGSSIIFVGTRKEAEMIQRHMEADGFPTQYLHAGLTPDERDAVIERFRSGSAKVLIATNVLARGIDVLHVTLVINFDIPVNAHGTPEVETYLHRIGRTGRFGRHGTAINLVDSDKTLDQLRQIEKYLNRPIASLPTDDLEALEERLKDSNPARK